MPLEEEKIKKLYYSIGEVSKMFEVNASLIRFWEKEFSVIRPKKNKKGNRLFTEKDIENIRLVYDLVKVKGYTLEGAKSHMKSRKNEVVVKVSDNPQIIDRLEGIKSELNEILLNL
jgi:DNA-binding transcriptional MerR regulator